jgi:hypothetical protein
VLASTFFKFFPSSIDGFVNPDSSGLRSVLILSKTGISFYVRKKIPYPYLWLSDECP